LSGHDLIPIEEMNFDTVPRNPLLARRAQPDILTTHTLTERTFIEWLPAVWANVGDDADAVLESGRFVCLPMRWDLLGHQIHRRLAFRFGLGLFCIDIVSPSPMRNTGRLSDGQFAARAFQKWFDQKQRPHG
jgi:hypothetical protein